jgi:hypothetical protein
MTALLGWTTPATAQNNLEDPAALSTFAAQTTTSSWQFILIASPITSSTVGAMGQMLVQIDPATKMVRDNAVALQQDLTVGDGPMLRDFATILGLEHEDGRVGRALRAERRALLDALREVEAGERDARHLMQLALAACAKDETLRPYVERVVLVNGPTHR